MRDSAPSRRMLRAAAPAARTGSVLKKTVAAGAVLGVAAAAYGHFIELNNFVVRHERLPVLPAGTADLRIRGRHVKESSCIRWRGYAPIW